MVEPFTTLGLAKTTSDLIKEAMDLARSAKNTDLAEKLIDLYRDFVELMDTTQQKIAELQRETIELSRQKLQLEQKVDELEKRVRLKAEMIFKEPLYFRENDSTPFCPACLECNERAAHLVNHGSGTYSGIQKTHWYCQLCHNEFFYPTTPSTS
jgi:hypothetical protein